MKNEKGLTLIELLAVIVILAIIAAIAIPSIGNVIDNQRDKAILAEMSNVISEAKIAYVDGTCGPTGTCAATNLKIAPKAFTIIEVSGLPNTPSLKYTIAANTFKGTRFKITEGTDKVIAETALNDKMEGK